MKAIWMKIILIFFVTHLLVTKAMGQNLIMNPSCDLPLVNGEIPFWMEVIGTGWTQINTPTPPQSGPFYFFAGKEPVAELIQEIDVMDYSCSIDNGMQKFNFSGYVRAYEQNNNDESNIIIECLDNNNSVLNTYNSGSYTTSNVWVHITTIIVSPPGTRRIKIHLKSVRHTGANNDGYYDNLSLSPLSSSNLQIDGVSTTAANCGGSNGEIIITTSGGSGGLQYSLDGILFQTSNHFSNLPGGPLTVYVKDSNGCTDSQQATIADIGQSYSITLKPTICPGDSLKIGNSVFNQGNPSGTVAFLTDLGCDSIIKVQLTIAPMPITVNQKTSCHIADTGTVVQVLKSWLHCDSTVITTTNFDATLIPKLDLNEMAPLCPGELGSISVEPVSGGTAPFSYQLDGNSPQSSGIFNNLLPGTYSILVTDVNGCSESITGTLYPAEELIVTFLPHDITIKSGDTIQLQSPIITPSDLMQGFFWYSDQWLSCFDCLTPSAAPLTDVVFTIEVNYNDDCIATATIQVNVIPNKQFYIPNAIKPQGDYLTVFGVENDLQEIVDFQVFNRWGESVFSRRNFPPNDPSLGWDGTWRGNDALPGVYGVMAKLSFRDGQTVIVTNDVTVIR